jgi:ABC-type branched-subunit amino acid transport system permease subunit
MLRFCVAAFALFACISLARSAELLTEPAGRLIISVRDQKLMFVQSGVKPITYRVSTSGSSANAIKETLNRDWLNRESF